MSTRYTSYVGEGISFEKWAMLCARNFGACIEMREESMDKPIPQEFKPSDYHVKERKDAERELEKYKKMSLKDAEKFLEKEYEKTLKERQDTLKSYRELRKKYEDMRMKVVSWHAPENHDGLKKFMIQQLDESIRFDCNEDYIEMPKKKNAKTWLNEKILKCIKDIEYHEKEYEAEVSRIKSRNNWIRELRESLGEK